MRSLICALGVALLVVASAPASHANMFVSISDGVRVPELRPESGARYTISLCVNGAESDSGADSESLVAPGLCIPEQAFMTLR